jgi:hypothetical protein
VAEAKKKVKQLIAEVTVWKQAFSQDLERGCPILI